MKKGFNLLGSISQWKKVMWSDESRLTMFHSDGHMGVRREVDKVMYLTFLVPCMPVMMWGFFI